MKKILIFILFLSSISVYAQDVITLRNGEQIRARVTEISQTELRYKRFEHLDGPTIVIQLATVFAINYENGTRDVINPLTTETQQTATSVAQGQAAAPAVATPQTAGRTEQNVRTQNQHQSSNREQTSANTSRSTALGGNLVIGTGDSYTHLGIGAKFLFGANNFRTGVEFDFFPKQEEVSWWDFSLYTYYLIPVSDQVALFPLVGLGFAGATAHLGQSKVSDNSFAFSLVGGLDIALSPKLTLSGELRFKLLSGGYRTNIAIGLAHKL